MDEKLPPELQEIADLLWEHAHGAPPIENDKVWRMIRDHEQKQWFDSGWEACRREVLAMANHQGGEAAVDWVSRHPTGQHESNSTSDEGPARACKKCGAYGGKWAPAAHRRHPVSVSILLVGGSTLGVP